MSTTTARQPAGVPTGGQFAAGARAEGIVTLTIPPLGFVPADLTGLDDDDLAVLRRGVEAKLDRARFVVNGADHDRRRASDWGDRAELEAVDKAEAEAFAEMDSAIVDLTRITGASCAGKMSRDDMTKEQRDLVDATHRHAYDYADKAVGGIVLQCQDEAEEYAAYVVQRLIREDFDDAYLSHPHLLRDFDRERAGRLALKITDDPDEKRWVTRMAMTGGMSTANAGNAKGAVAVSRLAHTLTQQGFYVDRDVSTGNLGVTFTLTGGRPHPHLAPPA